MAIPLNHHADMLGDHVRLEKFKKAIHGVVRSSDDVVDIGAGLGVLSAYVGARTSGRVCSIEYFSDVSSMALQLFRGQPRHTVKNARSYDVQLDRDPDVIVSETIGAVGPEESIVELLYDFKRRHPGVRDVVPQKLSLFAQAVRSDCVEFHYESLLSKILGARCDEFRVDALREQLEEEYCRQVHQFDLSGSTLAGHQIGVVAYELGVDEFSDFTKCMKFNCDGDWNAVSLHFEAELAEGVTLRNSIEENLTHWMHSFIKRPAGRSELHFAYDSELCKFTADWR